jgi:hypothetical protein
MGTKNRHSTKIKKKKQISDSVFNLLFKDLVESEKIKLYMDEVKQHIYEGEMSPDELSERLSELTDRYMIEEMNQEDRASVIRYISAFVKIENNVKANLCALNMKETGNDSVQQVVDIYKMTQQVINEWAKVYAHNHGLAPEWVSTPDLEWVER